MKKTVLCSLILISQSGFANGDYREISEKLIQVRQEVESLSRQQEIVQKERSEVLEGLLRRKSELEQQARKERLRSSQLAAKVEMAKKAVTPVRIANSEERKVLESWSQELKDWIQSSLPFQKESRLAAVDRIEMQIKRKDSPELILGSLWQVTEKELRLTHDNSYEVMDLKISGEVKKSEVVRLGMMQMLFRTADGQGGYAVLENGKWQLVPVSDKREIAAIERLLSKLKEQQGRGYFEVPGLKLKETL